MTTFLLFRYTPVTPVLVRHKPQWHRHGPRGFAVVPSLIAVAPRKTVKTADLRGGTAQTFNMFRRASAVLSPSRRRGGATAVLVRHKPQWRPHDRSPWYRSGSVIDRHSTAENCQNRGPSRWHGENFEHVQNFRSATAGWANPQWGRRGTAMAAVAPYKDRSSTSITAVLPQYNRRAIYGDHVAVVLRLNV